MNSFLLLLSLVVVHHLINYLIFNVSILYLVDDPSSLLLQKSGIIYLPHFVYLLHIVHSVPNLKLFSFHHSLIFFYMARILTGLCLNMRRWTGFMRVGCLGLSSIPVTDGNIKCHRSPSLKSNKLIKWLIA